MGLQSKIIRRSLEAQAADVLRDRIVSGKIPNGARLTEMSLAVDLGLSRGPVRAALQQLSNEQLVIQKPYAGWEVRRLCRKDVWEISTLRSALEGLAAQLAAQKVDERSARDLRAALKRLEAACATGRHASVTAADFALHRMIIDLSDHERLRHAYLLLDHQIRMVITATNAPFDDMSPIAEAHCDMIEAICRGDCEAAQQFATDHNTAYYEALLDGMVD